MLTREEYEAKRQARYERLLAAAQRNESEGKERIDHAREQASIIPFGQPILIGHHSEGRDRRYRARIENGFRKGYEMMAKASALRERADAMKKCNAIFSDDPDACQKIEDKIKRLEVRQEMMKRANKLARAGDRNGLVEMGFSDAVIDNLLASDFCGRIGFPDYELKNNNANIRRLKERLVQVETMQGQEDTEYMSDDIRIIKSPSENRIRLFFTGKPASAVRDILKRNGFRWTPSMGCWQAYYSVNVWLDSILEKVRVATNA